MNYLSEWGECMKLARRASNLAINHAKVEGSKFTPAKWQNPIDAAIILYTDDPSTAGLFLNTKDMSEICNASHIVDVCIVSGDKFPEASFEADRKDKELPRVAAMFLPALGDKCPRCRKVVLTTIDGLCQRCHDVVN